MDSIETLAISTALVIGVVNIVLIRNYLGSVKPIPGVRKLVVTAHPDDESMFFAPFIVWETLRGSSVHLMCLSNGDYQGQGLRRSQEIKAACRELGVPERFLHVVSSPEFEDNPDIAWNTIEIQRLIVQYCEKHSIQAVISFDSKGVSGHPNHVSIYRALVALSKNPLFLTRLYVLDTVSVFRKYFALLDILCTMLTAPEHIYSLNAKLNEKPQRAMLKHSSQLVWFRHLYRWFSKYMILNTFTELPSTTRATTGE